MTTEFETIENKNNKKSLFLFTFQMESLKKRKRNLCINIENEDGDDSPDNHENDEEYLPLPKKKKTMKISSKVASIKIKKELCKNINVKKKACGSKKKSSTTKKETHSKLDPTNIKEEVIENQNKYSKENNAVRDIFKGTPEVRSFADKIELDVKPDPSNMKEEEILKNNVKQLSPFWKDEEVVAQTSCVSLEVAKSVINLLNQDCTIPFIVRYRKQMTGGLQAEKLREIQDSYEEVKQVHKKIENILKTTKHENFDENTATAFLHAKTLEEVEFLYAPFKPSNKRTLAERSKELGLELFAIQIMKGHTPLTEIKMKSIVKKQKGLENEKEILTGIQHIIADKISKNEKVLDYIRQMIHHRQIRIQSSKSLTAEKADRAAFVEGKNTQSFKYENYFELNMQISNLSSHQVLALNRGEKQKILKVKVQIPHMVKKSITDFIISALFPLNYDFNTKEFMIKCVDDAYERLIEPYMCRQIRTELTKKAERESIFLFGENVKSLLLTPPVRGKTVMGVDPGFTHGCKIGVVSSKGEVLTTDVIYPHSKIKSNHYPDPNAEKVLKLISTHRCDIIAIGNGTACRETEVWLSNLNNSQFFHPFQVKYCIVNENGVSIYSVTKEAEIELPNMDPNFRSAVSIARRLQDPLLEYVKIEPKHLGVGMYQHDIPESQLKKALDRIVEECVSFVGVDINVCPETLLRKISGLSTMKAKQIVEWRTKNGCFVNRQQLLEVKGLGQKTYEQCAGFVKILPETSTFSSSSIVGSKLKKKDGTYKSNPLDRTIIHPESYTVAEKFLQELEVDYSNIGQQTLVDKVNSYTSFKSVEKIADLFSVPAAVMQLIIDAFKQLQDYDIRKEFDEPLFRTSIQKLSDIRSGQELTGRVTNVTGFGAFVDIGVDCNGLIHVSKMKGRKLNVGDRVTVNVIDVNFQKKRIGLEIKM